jgi:PadR family transcriptional regulator PadR
MFRNSRFRSDRRPESVLIEVTFRLSPGFPQGTLYPVLLRLEQEGAIASEWGPSENNRRARFYRLTRAGRKLLETEKHDWEQTAAIIARFFEVKAEDLA